MNESQAAQAKRALAKAKQTTTPDGTFKGVDGEALMKACGYSSKQPTRWAARKIEQLDLIDGIDYRTFTVPSKSRSGRGKKIVLFGKSGQEKVMGKIRTHSRLQNYLDHQQGTHTPSVSEQEIAVVKQTFHLANSDIYSQEPSVSARELYAFLDFKGEHSGDFEKWLERMLRTCDARLNIDFMPESHESFRHSKVTDVLLTLNLVKHFAMMARTKRGHAIREFFIRAEKQLHENLRLENNPRTQQIESHEDQDLPKTSPLSHKDTLGVSSSEIVGQLMIDALDLDLVVVLDQTKKGKETSQSKVCLTCPVEKVSGVFDHMYRYAMEKSS